jgi:cysteine synthase A
LVRKSSGTPGWQHRVAQHLARPLHTKASSRRHHSWPHLCRDAQPDAAARRTARPRQRRPRRRELDPLNLFNINWKNTGDEVEKIVLPKELTGVQANIVVLSGRTFPSGSMKVGPAYATLAEHEALDHLRPGDRTVIGPSTGNFGIGTAYISMLKGYDAIVVMPDNMSKERYERIRRTRASSTSPPAPSPT